MTEKTAQCGKDCLTKEDIDYIAEKAAERALDKFYADVGKSVIKRGAVVIVSVGVALATYFKLRG